MCGAAAATCPSLNEGAAGMGAGVDLAGAIRSDARVGRTSGPSNCSHRTFGTQAVSAYPNVAAVARIGGLAFEEGAPKLVGLSAHGSMPPADALSHGPSPTGCCDAAM